MTTCLAGIMRRRGHSVTVLGRSTGGTLERHILGNGVEVIGTPTLELARLRSYWEEWPEIVHLVDLVWPDFPQAAHALAREWAVPFIVTPASAMSTWQDKAAALAICQEADRVFVLTESERQHFGREGVLDDRLVVIGQGPHLVGEANPQAFRRKYEISGPMVLYLGRKTRSKGYDLLLMAASDVWRDYPTTHFVFIGPRWDSDCAELFATYADPRIIEIGLVDEAEKHNALAASDVVCVPSTVDVFPLVYVEAWACGKPVIASRFPGSEEIVLNGYNGLIASPESSSVARAVRSVLANDSAKRAMGRNGLRSVQQRFNWRVVADSVEPAYRLLAAHAERELDQP